ncbi:P-loop containing nucleoside triphosphate hydrolase protein [Fomitiporia mediterranea MF3/22]|uniref:P-loop containing nucleoside triphosphate hydrolase protein n=1 Tax=Fomitiporia mediterranea (strain MF3/22) TaxID=694068 RepID=UPI0004407981|nr:P-loop containing nucleoside triphosphate hydrolase protein [Fomitiporia mediterranea MF3/22]EJC98118.1 P-loop containing nucleoside triphosphate hydrolase protein [Fomitiporia mediterranea MF3/22]
MGHLRERHNAKARQSSRPTKRAKHAHHTSDIASKNNNDPDPNSLIHVPKSEEQKNQERRERLRQELLEQQANSKVTSKKKRRLEKYIDKKLKKEERVQLLEKLAQTQAQLPTTLHLQPSSTLGSRKVQTHEELQAKQEDKEVRRIMEGRGKGGRRKRNMYSGMDVDTDEDSGTEEDNDMRKNDEGSRDADMEKELPGSSPESPVIIFDEPEDVPKILPQVTDAVGSALRRNKDGTLQEPKVLKRQPKGPRTAFKRWGDRSHARTNAKEPDASSESSFDSSDSAYDSSEHKEENSGDSDGDNDDDDSGSSASEDDSNGDTSSEEEQGDSPPSSKRKRGGFKDWAMQQLSEAKGYVALPSKDEANDVTFPLSRVSEKTNRAADDGPREMRGPLGEDIHLPDTTLAQELKPPTNIIATDADKQEKVARKFVTVTRSDAIQTARLELPILAEEQPIVEAIRMNPVIVLCGETGSGKTTQVPQFLYEAGFGCPGSDNPGMIGITQPRRVAAMSMAARVGQELSLPPPQVAYQIRYDATTSPKTVIKFMTDGILLRELASDFTLSKYSVVIVDEAHERSVNTDILIGVLSRVIRLREELWKAGKDGAKPLRLIIMSATLRVSDFAENPTLFPTPPPILRVDARQHPVAVHFSRRTYPDYVTETIKKASKIHARLPPGGILIFLTSQNEITGVCRKLASCYGKSAIMARKKRRGVASVRRTKEDDILDDQSDGGPKVAPAIASVEVEDLELGDFKQDDEAIDDGTPPRELDPEALDTDEEDEENKALGIDFEDSEAPMHILPLYSILPTEQQMRVFEPPPEGSRLVVVATNVAETSLTIPGIRYVVDCGRAKERCYDVSSGVQSFRVNWISKASANQRAGRAGRTGPGHCYRLYSSALFENHFDQFARPEILQMPIEGVVLQMKSMHIDTITNFPFPTPPDRTSLRKAEVLLTRLGALSPTTAISRSLTSSADNPITELGKTMALFPLSPRFAKMLVSGRQHGCLPYVITIVAALSVGDPFLHEEALQTNDSVNDNEGDDEVSVARNGETDAKELNRLRRRAFFKSQEIHSKMGKGLSDVFRDLSVVGACEYAGGGQQFCREHFVRPKAMEEIHKLRAQISSIVSTNFPGIDTGFASKLKPPSDLQLKVLRQLICSAFIDQVAVRKDLVQSTAISGNKYASARGVPYRALGIEEDAFIHPSSVLHNKSPPDYVIFQEAVHSSKLWLKNLTVVNPAWLSALGKGTLCAYSKPAKNSSGELMVIPRFGPEDWELPAIKADSMR